MLYQEENIEKTIQERRHTRSYSIIVSNPLNGVPNINYYEERVVTQDGVTRSTGFVGILTEVLTPENIDAEFDVLDQTGAVVGIATYGEVQAVLYSLYFHLATKRDAAAS
jgi:hypothetical protein